jgi:hypothetical protein
MRRVELPARRSDSDRADLIRRESCGDVSRPRESDRSWRPWSDPGGSRIRWSDASIHPEKYHGKAEREDGR